MAFPTGSLAITNRRLRSGAGGRYDWKLGSPTVDVEKMSPDGRARQIEALWMASAELARPFRCPRRSRWGVTAGLKDSTTGRSKRWLWGDVQHRCRRLFASEKIGGQRCAAWWPW